MRKKMSQNCGIVVLILVIISLVVLGCRQAPPPGQTPPPAGTVQAPAPAGTIQTPAPGGSAQMPAPSGTAQTTQAGNPPQDPNQVLVGMTPEQVQQIMGSPEQLYQQGFIEWKYSTPVGKVDVRFQNNKVTLIERYKNQK